tara:strand:- start:4027 stop:4233 length:207 start_codon:yes stop_codon:yes gene_type:complete
MGYDYFIDVRIVGLENVFEFLNFQNKQFVIKGMQFEHDILAEIEEEDTYTVRMWMNPQDYIDFYGSKT